MPDSIPAGTVVSYAADYSASVLEADGWLLCDGSSYPVTQYPDLFAAIGTAHGATLDSNNQPTAFNVPNLSARFIRGVNGAAIGPLGPIDPGVGARFPAATNGNSGNNVGSMQLDATSLPTSGAFTLAEAGNHTHTYSNATTDTHKIWKENNTHFSDPGNPNAASSQGGAHTHQINGGGDAVTRPKNMALTFMIKHSNNS